LGFVTILGVSGTFSAQRKNGNDNKNQPKKVEITQQKVYKQD
jgi:hypothetical protein